MINGAMILAVACGGALGAVLRYLVSLAVGGGIFGMSGPLSTLLVNFVGCGSMGVLAGAVAAGLVVPELTRGLLAVGFLGALTTFSSFAIDAGNLLHKHGLFLAAGYVGLSVGLSLTVFACGFWLANRFGVWH